MTIAQFLSPYICISNVFVKVVDKHYNLKSITHSDNYHFVGMVCLKYWEEYTVFTTSNLHIRGGI